jgi:uncharacterized protein (DUF2237 family)
MPKPSPTAFTTFKATTAFLTKTNRPYATAMPGILLNGDHPNRNNNANDTNGISTQPPSDTSTNVLGSTLQLFSRQPLTGFHRDGYCRVSAMDFGNHSVAGILTDEFLDFSATRGNDLRLIPGMRGGCKWCLCAGRWREALEAFREGRLGREGVPK